MNAHPNDCGCKECDYFRKHPQLRPKARMTGDFHYHGIGKRELFAAMAMQAYISCGDKLEDSSARNVAKLAIARADALLTALERGTP